MLGRSPLAALALAFVGSMTAITGPAQAGVVVDATRVIYPASRKEVSISLHNTGEVPALVQAWTDAGNAAERPGEANAPFALTPPLFRLDPANGQTLRLIYTQSPLAADRETVFWLNVLDIPPRVPSNPQEPNRLEMAFRHRMKILFRPQGLPGNPADAASAVTWSIVRQDGKAMLEARNPTPYFVSFSTAEVAAGGITATAAAEMVAPFASKRFALDRPELPVGGPVTIRYGFIDDFGAARGGSASASVASD